MFKKLHLQLSLFFTAVAGLILIIMTVVCLALSESSTNKNNYMSFVNNVHNLTSYMEVQNIISFEWLTGQEQDGAYLIAVYDQGKPLFMDAIKHTNQQQELIAQARDIALKEFGFDIHSTIYQSLTDTQVFTMADQAGILYYCSAAVIPKQESGRTLFALILHSRKKEQQSLLEQRWFFLFLDLAALAALGIFCWSFTRRIIHPVEESKRKQEQFIASASHELRAPLAVILAGATAAEEADREDAPRFLASIRSEARRMSHMVDEMLSLAAYDAHRWNIKKVPAQLDTLVLDTYENYEALAKEKAIHLEVTLPDHALPDCLCDRERVTQVLSILLDNALSYTPAEGQVGLTLSYEDAGFVIRVQDSGPGVPEEQKQRIFERFYRGEASRTDKAHFGLGLSIAKEIIVLHDGRIWVEDAPEHGAIFSFILTD